MQSDSRSRSRRRAAAAVAVLFLFGSIAGYAASRPRAEHRAAAPVAAERARPAPTATAPPPTPAPARVAPRPHGPRAQWLHLARALAAPWPRLQRQAGNFPDFTDGLIPGQSGAGTRPRRPGPAARAQSRELPGLHGRADPRPAGRGHALRRRAAGRGAQGAGTAHARPGAGDGGGEGGDGGHARRLPPRPPAPRAE